MKFPTTAKVAAAVLAASAPVITWAQSTFHWVAGQTLAVSTVTATAVAFLAFVVEHVRKETPSRWVGIFGTLTPLIPAVGALGTAFAWWTAEVSAKWTGSLVAAVAFLAGIAGVSIAQGKVTSPETRTAELASTAAIAQASARRGGDGTGVPPA